MTLELTDQETEMLAQLLDIATKAGGLQVAQASLHFFNKLKPAQVEASEEATPKKKVNAPKAV
jgi:hypothetical protein